MPEPIRLLVIEDSEDDAALLARELGREGFAPLCTRVETASALKSALKNYEFDVIISDFSLPAFTALEALEIVKSGGFDLPFIVVSGSAPETAIVDALRHGARDYVMKENLTRLPLVIRRELDESIERRRRRGFDEQLRHTQRLESVGLLAGGIAHDFNNVLSAIMMATDFLLNAHKPTDPSFKDIMQIKQNANRAAALVRQLLAFSRKQTLRPQVLDLGEVLGDLAMLLKRLIGEKVTLDVTHGRDLWPVKVDISQFEQVVVNLAVNARDAMPDGGKLTLRTAKIEAKDSGSFGTKGMPSGDYVLVEVSDTGTGIPPDIIDKIFEPFFTTKEVGKGTGLGLSTVYGIVKQTGGYIYADSEPGRTTFRIFLPRHVPAAHELAAPAESKTAAAPGADLTGQGKILLVEDEEGLRALNARGLASRGYTVLEASNGVEAIEVLEREGRVDLVVSDVVMPEMDGPSLLKELRTRDASVKVIFVSGYAEEAFAKNLPQGEQYAFLAKPFTLKQLVAEVKKTLVGA
jgi:two-component system, cell cycle sensor histidine kinase and response regulator CckA